MIALKRMQLGITGFRNSIIHSYDLLELAFLVI